MASYALLYNKILCTSVDKKTFNLFAATVPLKCNVTLVRTHELARSLKTRYKVDVAPVSNVSLLPLIGRVKIHNQNGCHAHFLVNFFNHKQVHECARVQRCI